MKKGKSRKSSWNSPNIETDWDSTILILLFILTYKDTNLDMSIELLIQPNKNNDDETHSFNANMEVLKGEYDFLFDNEFIYSGYRIGLTFKEATMR